MPRSKQTTGGWSLSWAPQTGSSAAEGGEGDRRPAADAMPSVGYTVPYRFRVEDDSIRDEKRRAK